MVNKELLRFCFNRRESGDSKDHPPQALKEKIEAGELGVKSGKGSYAYPDPEFSSPDFLKP
jgi:3-hydroxyacyl-CoA dehydrogenase